MKLKKPNPGNHQCDAMRCKVKPQRHHQSPDGTLIELCKRHSDIAEAEYVQLGTAEQVQVTLLGPQCGHEDCYHEYTQSGFTTCYHNQPVKGPTVLPQIDPTVELPEPEIREPAALAKVEASSSALVTLTKAAFVAELQADAEQQQELLEIVKGFEVKTQEDFTFLEGALAEVKGNAKSYEGRRTRFTKPANAILREFNGWFKPVLQALAEIEKVAKQKLSAYRLAQIEEQKRLVEAARAAETPKEIQRNLVAASEAVPVHSTTQIVDRWVFEVEDPLKLPREYLIPDEKKIGGIVRVMKDKTSIPGVRVWNATDVRSSSK